MKTVLGIDIGGTGIKMGLVKGTEIFQPYQFPMPREDYRQLPQLLKKAITEKYQGAFSGIALSSTGIVNQKDRSIGWRSPLYEAFGKTLVADLEKTYGVFVSVENDGNCAALAENAYGAGKGCQSILTVVLGTSVGGAFVYEGKILRGAHNLAGEFGYLLFPDLPKKDWELWSIVGSTRALVENVAQRKSLPFKSLDGKKVTDLLEQHDATAAEEVAKFIEKLAVGCYSLQYAFDPEKILIGGGISKAPYLIPRLQEKILEIAEAIPSNVLIPEVAACAFGNESNLLGAYHHFLQTYH